MADYESERACVRALGDSGVALAEFAKLFEAVCGEIVERAEYHRTTLPQPQVADAS